MEKLLEYLRVVPPVVEFFFALLTRPKQFLIEAIDPTEENWTNALLYYAVAVCAVTFWIADGTSIYAIMLAFCGYFFVVVIMTVFVATAWRLVGQPISAPKAAIWALYAFPTMALLWAPFLEMGLTIVNSIEALATPGHPTGLLRQRHLIVGNDQITQLMLAIGLFALGLGITFAWLIAAWGALRAAAASHRMRSLAACVIFLTLSSASFAVYDYSLTAFYPQTIDYRR